MTMEQFKKRLGDRLAERLEKDPAFIAQQALAQVLASDRADRLTALILGVNREEEER